MFGYLLNKISSTLSSNDTTSTTTTTSPQQNQQTQQQQKQKTTQSQDVDDLNQFIHSMNINKSQSDLDLMLAIINDRLQKTDYTDALKQLKQFVFITIEALSHGAAHSNTDSTTYNQLQTSYQLPTMNKLEDLYQSVRLKADEATRAANETQLLEITLILSIIQQTRYLMLNHRSRSSGSESTPSHHEQQDDGFQLFTQYHAKQVLADIQPLIKELLRTNGLIQSNDLANRIKAMHNCWQALYKILMLVVNKTNNISHIISKQWSWNTTILEKNKKVKLKEWQASNMTIPLHNQSSMYLDQIFTIIQDRLKDQTLLAKYNDANSHMEDLIMNMETNQEYIDSIQYLLGVDELLDGLSAISEISFKYSNFIKENTPVGIITVVAPSTSFRLTDHHICFRNHPNLLS
ncbi:hypothetical protein SAMD00019534_007950 [Acytostelium subglobosum LB1]|uniref:hypothetical protein n=1 Tax=Acytostelium subglobosum LB1 TaxID=1410327 RepID=UPI000644C123|nr:hypothetical protein SAMD00019534_007950 [Acytostelium subglobosum LB1]GAM17620.1 hypothetical protein SAMD00019534_007950 [Acytostelium subglobosum LB1]|eukprot:XP_012758216.1 hypothetical protein SAMD00019534_007950 [Acytostelium subglobosum LB1]